MEDRKRVRDREWGDSLSESITVSQRDYRDRVVDAEKRKAKHHFLSAYTKANKEVNELTAQRMAFLWLNYSYRIFLNRNRGYYFLFLNLLYGFYLRAAFIKGRLPFFLHERVRLEIGGCTVSIQIDLP